MIYLSYFSKYKGENGVSIAVGTPTWYNCESCRELFPPWKLVQQWKRGEITRKEYRVAYIRQLKQLDVHEFYESLDGKVLLCYEKPDNFCHRKIIKEWFNRNGYACDELKSRSEIETCCKCRNYIVGLDCYNFCSVTGEVISHYESLLNGCNDWRYFI